MSLAWLCPVGDVRRRATGACPLDSLPPYAAAARPRTSTDGVSEDAALAEKRRADAQSAASLSKALKERTADVHARSDALVNAKMALAFADRAVW